MKAKLIIMNWLLSWIPLCYVGEDIVVAACVVGWFGFSTWLLNRYKRMAMLEIDRLEKWVDKVLINSKKEYDSIQNK